MNNLRQVGLALHVYRGDYNDRMPDNGVWASSSLDLLIPSYCTSNVLYGTKQKQPCPEVHYVPIPNLPIPQVACNCSLMCGHDSVPAHWDYYHRLSEVKNPSTTFLIAHGFQQAVFSWWYLDTMFDGSYDTLYTRPYWSLGTHFYFMDDHMEWIPYEGNYPSTKWNKVHPSPDSSWYGPGLLIFGP